MIKIRKAELTDIRILVELGKQSFIESHGHSASEKDIDEYINLKYTPLVFEKELLDVQNQYYLISLNDEIAGYAKIIFNQAIAKVEQKNIVKLERLYLLKSHYGKQLGFTLFQYLKDLALKNKQVAIWLFVWKENDRALRFYTKLGFEIIGSYDFKISETHANPNHQMLLMF